MHILSRKSTLHSRFICERVEPSTMLMVDLHHVPFSKSHLFQAIWQVKSESPTKWGHSRSRFLIINILYDNNYSPKTMIGKAHALACHEFPHGISLWAQPPTLTHTIASSRFGEALNSFTFGWSLSNPSIELLEMSKFKIPTQALAQRGLCQTINTFSTRKTKKRKEIHWSLYSLIWDFLLSQINIWTATTWSNVWVVLPKPSWYES